MSISGKWALASLLLFLSFATAQAEPVDVNSASAAQLAAALVGVGEARAQAIVDYREQHGPFASLDELMKVSGVGAQIIDANRGDIRFGKIESPAGGKPGQ